jgi:hypothetical protein
MKKLTRKILLLIAAAPVLYVLITLEPEAFENNQNADPRITVSSELQDISTADIENVKREVRVALGAIPQILGVSSYKATNIQIVESGICYATDGTVSLSVDHIRDSSAPIIHEVTHILANHGQNSFFSEGLAVYFQERFGRTSGFPNFSVPLDELVRYHQGQLLGLQQLFNDNEIFGQVGTEQRRLAYIEAGSFINFLVEKYGEQKLAELHNSKNLDFKKVYGKKLRELEREWNNHVFGGRLKAA